MSGDKFNFSEEVDDEKKIITLFLFFFLRFWLCSTLLLAFTHLNILSSPRRLVAHL